MANVAKDNEIKKNSVTERQPLKLLKNQSYPTYQLYVSVSNENISPNDALVIAVLETMSWLRKRFREFDIPDEINFPEPENYEKVNIDDFKSFRINEGYIVDVIFVKEKLMWAFHLIEPDLGPEPGNENQKRKPVAGRVFETNIAFEVHGDKLYCGFKTICSEPVGTVAPCEVFRLAVIKSMVNNKMLGLKQIIPISQETYLINSFDKVNLIADYIKNIERHMPFVLIVEYNKEIDIDSAKKNMNKSSFNLDDIINRNVPSFNSIEKVSVNKDDLIREKLKELVKHRMGYAQFGFLQSKYIDYFNNATGSYKVSNGCIRIIYPEQFKTSSKMYNYSYIDANESRFFKDLEDELQDFPKYRNIQFDKVKFINECRIEELQQVIDASSSKEVIDKMYKAKIDLIEKKYESKINMLNHEIIEKENEANKLNERISELESKLSEWVLRNKEIEESKKETVSRLQAVLERKNKLYSRPKKTEDIPQWVDRNFEDKLIFHDRAKDLISKTPSNEVEMDLLCDAIEFLANEYLDEKTGKISFEERNKVCSEVYNRYFEVTPSGDKSVSCYTKDYKVKYGTGFNGKPIEVPLNLHLKVGNTSKAMLRIYFFYDKEKRMIVVGSLPKHLKTTMEK